MNLKSERIQIDNGIHLNLIYTDKFKSNLLSYYFLRPLSKDEVTKNALLPLVLKRGTEEYDTNLKIQKKLEETYGANFSISINKRGEKQVLRFTVESINGDYVGDKDNIYEVIDLLKDIIYNPTLEKGYFRKDYVNQEKENLKNRIEGRINDKRSYALDRCIEEMCKNEKFSIYPLGKVEDLDGIDENILYEHYKNVIITSPMEIFYVGEYDAKLIEYIKDIGKIERKELLNIPREQIISGVQTKNMVSEDLDVTQGKLVLGFRTGIPYEDRLYNGLIVASDILGGGPNSKLFRNVREKESLAYYITSTIYKYKSIMLIDGGIEFQNFEKTIDIINEQLEEMKKGNFTEEDIEISKKSIKSSTESIRDSAFLISEYFFSQILSMDNRSLEEILEDIDSVTKEEIVEAISHVVLDTIYFMKSSKNQ
ncbi:insulinase family protein [Tissierella pigra]|uniref:Insulinase family protein n=1 Tax=Tissierella pigra TaxID=2607614 RepID=A0A6N7XH06_9FIRM|nr:pitrilysin family protein [Tissierella pigra]MBU5426805.1 insulinase family protein [Tissierella pigra]MSU01321.1 insulinase family protein [Tissierella pigra]